MKKRTKFVAMLLAIATLMGVTCTQAFAAWDPNKPNRGYYTHVSPINFKPYTGTYNPDYPMNTYIEETDPRQPYHDMDITHTVTLVSNTMTNLPKEDNENRRRVDEATIQVGKRGDAYMKGIIGGTLTYSEKTGWMTCPSISRGAIPVDKTNVSAGITFELKDGVLTIKGDGKTMFATPNLSADTLTYPWDGNKHIKVIVFDGAFLNAPNFNSLRNLETVIWTDNQSAYSATMPGTFIGCPKLKNYIIGTNLNDMPALLRDNPGQSNELDSDVTSEVYAAMTNDDTGRILQTDASDECWAYYHTIPNQVFITSYYNDWNAEVAKARTIIEAADLPDSVLAMIPTQIGGTMTITKPIVNHRSVAKNGMGSLHNEHIIVSFNYQPDHRLHTPLADPLGAITNTPTKPVTPEKPVETTKPKENITNGLDDKTFSDWAFDNLDTAASFNLIPFQALGTNYKTAITRGQFCALATRLCEELNGEELPYDTDVFTDVDNTNTDILKMYKAGIIGGYGNGKFGPNDPLTREQAATILARLSSVMGTELSITKTNSFTDKFNTWAVEPVAKVFSAGIMSGYNATTFGAKDNYTIEQSIVTMLRIFGELSDDIGMESSSDNDNEPSVPVTPETPETIPPVSKNIFTMNLNEDLRMVKGTNSDMMPTITILQVWDMTGDMMKTMFTINNDHTVTMQNSRMGTIYEETTYDSLIIKDADGNVVFDSENA